MNAERMREFLLGMPHVVEAEQWGGLLYWVGDKAIGGKTFAMVNLEAAGGLPISFPAGPERYAELVEREGLRPAPYAAKNFWVAAERWDALRDREWEEELTAAHQITFAKLTPKTKNILAMSKSALRRMVAERKELLAARAAAKTKG
jgi:predicted DNA-binding protein (MmcQ/YjbR family)